MDTKLSEFWNKQVNKGWRHFHDKVPPEKVSRILKSFDGNVVKRLDMDKINTVLDWGCGGGLLAKEIVNHVDSLTILDIAQTSLDSALKYVGEGKVQTILMPNDPKDFNSKVADLDLLMCFAVIQHFPSLDYWKQISNIWKKLNPKYIACSIKTGAKNKEQASYFTGKNFLTGLILTKKEIESRFAPEYKLIHWRESSTQYGQLMGHVILERL